MKSLTLRQTNTASLVSKVRIFYEKLPSEAIFVERITAYRLPKRKKKPQDVKDD